MRPCHGHCDKAHSLNLSHVAASVASPQLAPCPGVLATHDCTSSTTRWILSDRTRVTSIRQLRCNFQIYWTVVLNGTPWDDLVKTWGHNYEGAVLIEAHNYELSTPYAPGPGSSCKAVTTQCSSYTTMQMRTKNPISMI